jgi:hypothetical protein
MSRSSRSCENEQQQDKPSLLTCFFWWLVGLGASAAICTERCLAYGSMSWTAIGHYHTVSYDMVAAVWTFGVVYTFVRFIILYTVVHPLAVSRISVLHLLIIVALVHYSTTNHTAWMWQSKDYFKDMCSPPRILRQYEGELCAHMPLVHGTKDASIFFTRSVGSCAFTLRLLDQWK